MTMTMDLEKIELQDRIAYAIIEAYAMEAEMGLFVYGDTLKSRLKESLDLDIDNCKVICIQDDTQGFRFDPSEAAKELLQTGYAPKFYRVSQLVGEQAKRKEYLVFD